MPTTTHGYPYPDGDDLVMEGNDAIQALAEAIETMLPGKVRFGASPATTDANGLVTIPHGLGATPVLVLAMARSSTNHAAAGIPDDTSIPVTVRNLSTAGAPVLASTAVNIYWLAIA